MAQWRDGDSNELRERLNRPVEGVLMAVQNNGHWGRAWGARPDPPEAAVAMARRLLAEVPRLVPIYGHRYLPAGRGTFGHPILSMVWNTDIICYGADLVDYFNQEFEEPKPERPEDEWRRRVTVLFWRDYL